MSDSTPKKKKKWFKTDLFRFFIVGLIFLTLALIIKHNLNSETHNWIQELRKLLQGANLPGGLWTSGLIFTLLGGASIGLGVPRLWVSGAAGAIYGVVLGTSLALIASMIGAATVYAFGYKLLGKIVERKFQNKLAIWQRRFQENAFWWVLYSRLFPFSNATLNSLLCGSCKVPFAPYMSASLLGFLPLTFVFASFGSGGIKGNINQIMLGFALLFIAVFIRMFYKKTYHFITAKKLKN